MSRRAMVMIAALASAMALGTPGRADDFAPATMQTNPIVSENFFTSWFERASAIQAEQPHWVTPLATVTPRLEQELRYDQTWQSLPGGHELDNYGGNKGVELIPFDPVEIIIGVPAYESENLTPRKNGWADETFLLKYRLASANEQNGNYIVTGFMGLSVPSGSANYTSGNFMYTPTIAAGKGWGDFDIQSTLGITVPDMLAKRAGPGMPVALNTTFQYRIAKYFWPEVEANYTYWPNGRHEGLNQLFITPALDVGRIPIHDRVGVTLAAGVQVAVTDHPLMHRNIIFSARLPF